jgi:ribosome biogenesis GTPase
MSFHCDWGFAPFFDDQIAADERGVFAPARVVEPGRTVVRVVTPDGVRLGEPAGRLYVDETVWPPAVGDWVLTAPMDDERVMVQRTLERRTGLYRKGRRGAQPLGANVDWGLIVLPLAAPIRLNVVERAIALIISGGVRPAVALTKADLCDDPALQKERVVGVAGDAPVTTVSVVTGAGVDETASIFTPGRTVALLGPSGAGKSSLVNRMAGAELMATGDVRDADGKGRHTTSVRRLIRLPSGGLVADIPGFRELGLSGEEADALDETFPDIAAVAVDCRRLPLLRLRP